MRLFFSIAALLMLFPLAAIGADQELKVGDDAPDFKMKGSDGKTYQLSDFKGKQAFVIAWFPKAFTSG
ncbi:MAG: redoxin domain-containing protein [Planctomycetales bacterium]|nr:redoxin domain-containing protein [Planctomycetales bacterium]